MEPSNGCGTWTLPHPYHHHHHRHLHHPSHHHHHLHLHHPSHHHHHHHHHLIICPYPPHHQHRLNYHCNVNARFASPPLQNSEPVDAFPLQNESKLEAGGILFKDDPDYDTQMLREQEYEALVEEEEVEEPVFVLTDEWREFFAASEAKRKMVKKQAKKK